MPAPSSTENLQRAHRLYAEGRFTECERLCRKILQDDPDQPRALSMLGYLALQGGALHIAIECFQRASALQPEYAGHRGVLATTLRLAGRHEEALESQKICVSLAPNDPEARQNLASQYAEMGDFELARKTYAQVLARAPLLGRAHYGLALIKKFQPGEPHIAQMQAALENQDLPPADRGRIAFALGKACEDLGEYDQAFEFYRLGNQLKRGLVSFDIVSEQRNAERIIEAFSDSLRLSRQGLGCQSERAVFIVGMPRSGSTLVEQIIDRHPDVHGAGELPNLFQTIERGLHGLLPEGSELPEAVGDVPPTAWLSLGESYAASIGELAPGALRIVDKQLFNYTLVGMLHLMLPKARIIHCVRDPLDTCVSCYTQNFGAERGFSCDLGELGRSYRLYEKLMAHWRQWLPEPMLEVVYEQVVAEPETQARRLIDFLGLEWSDACLSIRKSKRAVVTSSLGQVRAPVYSSSVGRWRRFEDHLQPLKDALASDV